MKTKHRRPLDSLLLDGNKIESLLEDAREFLELEDWRVLNIQYLEDGVDKVTGISRLGFRIAGDIYYMDLRAQEKVSSDSYLTNCMAFTTPISCSFNCVYNCTSCTAYHQVSQQQDIIQAGELGLEIFSLSLSSAGHVYECSFI